MKIVITGSSTGIGHALTKHLLTAGHQVWGIARSAQSSPFDSFRASRCDVSNWQQIEVVAEEIAATWTSIHALVACAGIHGEIGRACAADPINWTATLRANLEGTFYAIRAFHPLLTSGRNRAKIICFSGGGATKARANFSAYGVAKTGVVRLVETIAEEERNSALDINAIAPGAINTGLTQELLTLGPQTVGAAEYAAAQQQGLSGDAPLRKAIGLVEWLLSPASDGVSGRLLSAPWDPWPGLGEEHRDELAKSDIYMLRRIIPADRGMTWEKKAKSETP